MNWISVKDKLPEHHVLCYVMNEKGWMRGVLALYYSDHQVFVEYNPSSIIKLTLDVTHYIELPS